MVVQDENRQDGNYLNVRRGFGGVVIESLEWWLMRFSKMRFGPSNHANSFDSVNKLVKSFATGRASSHVNTNWCPDASHRKPGGA